MTPHLTF